MWPTLHAKPLVIIKDMLNIAEHLLLIMINNTQWGQGVLAIVEVEGAGSFPNRMFDHNFSREKTLIPAGQSQLGHKMA